MPRIHAYHLHLPHFGIDTGRNMRLLYGMRIMRDLVNKFTFIFLPIFLFQLGLKVHWFDSFGLSNLQRGVLMIAIFFLIVRIVVLVSAIPIGRMLSAYGYQKGLVIGIAVQLLAFLCLYYSQEQPMFIWGAMVLEAIQLNFFWNSFYVVLSKSMNKHHVGQDLTTMQFLLQLMAAITPAVSGVLAVAFGIESLFLFGIVGTLISLLFAIGLELGHERDSISWYELGQWLREPTYRRLSLSFIGRYFHDVVIFVWPLYVFLLLGAIDEVGFLYTLSLFLALVVTFFTGFYVAKNTNKKPFMISGGLLSLLWFVRTGILSVWSIAFVDMLEKLTANFHWLHFDMQYMRRGKGAQALSYYTYREMVMSMGAIMFWLLFALVFLFIPLSWFTIFVVAAVGVLFSVLVQEAHIVSDHDSE